MFAMPTAPAAMAGNYRSVTMASHTIDETLCNGCGCVAKPLAQKVNSISKHRMNANGYFVAEAVNKQNCIGCAFCAIMCPDCAIEVEK